MKKLSREQLRLILKILLPILIVMIFVSAYEVWNIWSQYQASINKYEKLESYVNVSSAEEDTQKEEAVEETREVEVIEEESPIKIDFDTDFEALKKINPDVIGWIYYEPLELSYPIVMDKGNDYYEHYAFDGERNVAGAIFLDYACRPDLQSFNSIIYGHNMRNGTMFGCLKQLLNDTSIIEKDPYFYVITEDKTYMYEIFATYLTRAGSQTYDLILPKFELNDMKTYISYINSVAQYRNEDILKDDEITDDTKIATLSTCHGVNSGNRTVIHGVLFAEK